MAPLYSEERIAKRHNIVENLLKNPNILNDIREDLGDVRDLERILAKVSTNKATAGDLINTAIAVNCYESIKKAFKR
jgi:DNA mismatch repair protein MutS